MRIDIEKPGLVGNIFPMRPQVDDQVCLTFRLHDSGEFDVFADRTHYSSDVNGEERSDFTTAGLLTAFDTHRGDLEILTGNRQHCVVGTITKLYPVINNGDYYFTVRWVASTRCSII